MLRAQRDDDVHIQHFLSWQKGKDALRKGYRASETSEEVNYISSASVKSYFDGGDRLEDILAELFWWNDGDRPNAAIMQDFTVVLAILLSIQQGHMIKLFCQKPELRDANLPFDTERVLPSSDGVDLQTLFCEQQYKYCHHTLRKGFKWALPATTILPFRIDAHVGQGGSAFVRKIFVDSDFNELSPDLVNFVPVQHAMFSQWLTYKTVYGLSAPTRLRTQDLSRS